MPIFEYVCKECQHQFEALVYGKEKAACHDHRPLRFLRQPGWPRLLRVEELASRDFGHGLFPGSRRRSHVPHQSPDVTSFQVPTSNHLGITNAIFPPQAVRRMIHLD